VDLVGEATQALPALPVLHAIVPVRPFRPPFRATIIGLRRVFAYSLSLCYVPTPSKSCGDHSMEYRKNEAKEWARGVFRGVCNVILPTFTSDLKRLNEKAIRHDVRRNIELGFWGALLVSECGTTMPEMKRFMEIAVDEAKGQLRTVLHGSFDTREDVLDACRHAEEVGVDALLLAYPSAFYPHTEREVYDYSRRVCDQTNLAVILFSAHQWNFARLHPSEMSAALLDELADIANVVAVKCEGGRPAIGYILEVHKRCGDRILVSDPMEFNSPVWVELFQMQWMGTSSFDYFGNSIPLYFELLHKGNWKPAMEIYWRIHSARQARLADMQSYAGANFIHRYSWKYMGWLNGMNGGPIRMPVMKLNDAAMKRLRDALTRSGIEPTVNRDVDFFIGRNPA
jgi:dihydrodipicolinate synthase/N-acetylneuraminate lyase